MLCSWAKMKTQTLASPRLINEYLAANETCAGLEIPSRGGGGEGWWKYSYSLHAVDLQIMLWPDGALSLDAHTILASGREGDFDTRLPDYNSGSKHGSYLATSLLSLPCLIYTHVQKLHVTPRKSNDLSSL